MTLLSFARRWLLAVLLVVPGAQAAPALATDFPVTLTDIAERQVTIDHAPERIFLDDPRHFFALAALLEKPVERLSGWRGTLTGFDRQAQADFETAFPALKNLPGPGGQGNGQISGEALITLHPDLVLVDLARYPDMAQSSLMSQLSALDIPVLVIDFKQHPLTNTPASLDLLGRVLNARERADALEQTITQHEQAVDHCVGTHDVKPRVLIDIAPGLKTGCCRSNFDSGIADLVDRAGGDNLAAGLSPGRENLINPEYILANEPDVIIATAAQWPGGESIRAGFGVTPEETRHDMANVVARRPGWADLGAVREGRFHALWHGHHQGPFGIVALEAIARWLHPQQCSALDPDQTMASLYQTFMPIKSHGTFQATWRGDEATPPNP
ncbi:ABC transporter substrate-binding protein [Kushneria sp. Sum13]|uniref:ABC transporter substrate-binding protein n=1 Tax=Kushneria sp. Sum13 TaxID=3459196 RepID=UPI0040451E23